MTKHTRRGNSQGELFPLTKHPTIAIVKNHRLVQLADQLDWTELEMKAEAIRRKKLKSAAGRPPQLRALLGAMVLRATRYVTYRVLEDQIRHYAPARYLCGLTETDWSPDHNTLHDFFALMGEEGARLINEYVVGQAVEEGLADPKVLVADTTAQEAPIPYPNEMGLMATFIAAVRAAGTKAGAALKRFVVAAGAKLKAAKQKVREYRLFAKTKERKDRVMAEMVQIVDAVQAKLAQAVEAAQAAPRKLTKYRAVAQAKVVALHATMKRLLPQIRHWLQTGRVASGKIISLHMPELYAIVRGKVGKTCDR